MSNFVLGKEYDFMKMFTCIASEYKDKAYVVINYGVHIEDLGLTMKIIESYDELKSYIFKNLSIGGLRFEYDERIYPDMIVYGRNIWKNNTINYLFIYNIKKDEHEKLMEETDQLFKQKQKDNNSTGKDNIVKSVKFNISRHGKYTDEILFSSPVTINFAIKVVKEYLSESLTQDYYEKIKDDTFHICEWKEAQTRFKCREDLTFVRFERPHVDNNGQLTFCIRI